MPRCFNFSLGQRGWSEMVHRNISTADVSAGYFLIGFAAWPGSRATRRRYATEHNSASNGWEQRSASYGKASPELDELFGGTDYDHPQSRMARAVGMDYPQLPALQDKSQLTVELPSEPKGTVTVNGLPAGNYLVSLWLRRLEIEQSLSSIFSATVARMSICEPAFTTVSSP